ncbi:DUF4760 domain-containing protein [Pasteurella multocida]|uniref:DUF4760 domain-containing protein n=1 Tax=Pasteurella multocida TaxID=747 RepID=UPI000999F32A|nr:DUF4760 domain-containing protein [Pasteurella multocida]ARA70968.1 DUF4760 domain-containing protein [Pasteurella multocida subsp. multocida]ARA88437.1 DUF4760 domain-containing protein [Pasteurella multocida subsp. septica]MBE7395163.1 DUF4760 domain-containing protein [Pasteurella multocida]MCL7756126.1 DUF4760 domain-containing protein [Pasteurella multocida]MCL7761705.1 DUF4760 domain-containing protein [Pasteurella multocida]
MEEGVKTWDFLSKLDINTFIGLGTCLFTGYLAFFAWSQLKELRKQHKQKATIELLISNSNNAYYRRRRQAYMKMRDGGVNFTSLACSLQGNTPSSSETDRQNFIVLDILNSIEFICVGIKENLFDEAVYKRMSKSSVITDWNTLKPYVMELRRIKNNNNKLFCEFEWLAEKWIKEGKNSH